VVQRIRGGCIGNDFDRHQKVLGLVWLSCKKAEGIVLGDL
jgi:hypothetical protein